MSSSTILCLNTGYLIESEAQCGARLADQQAPSSLSITTPPHGGYEHTEPCPAFYVGTGASNTDSHACNSKHSDTKPAGSLLNISVQTYTLN